jgi:pyruvate/2-oxoglutarate/acetoin dehydrogenase E1 component
MPRETFYSHAIREALREELRRDPSVFVLAEDIAQYGGAFKITEGFLDEFGPDRIINAPISENSFVGLCIGAALTGLRPITEMMFMDFITLAMDQLVNHAAKFRYMYGEQARVPLVVRCPAGAGRGYGPSHSQSLERYFFSTPGIKVAAPATAYDAKGMLKAAIRDDDPVIFLESKLLYGKKGEVPEEDYTVPLGQARLAHEGDDVTIIAYSRMVEEAMKAVEPLARRGISAEVLDLRSLCPLDMAAISESVTKCGRAVVAEEGHLTGGVGAEITARIVESCFDYLEAPVRRVAALDVPVPASRVLEDAATPDWEDIGRAAVEVVEGY